MGVVGTAPERAAGFAGAAFYEFAAALGAGNGALFDDIAAVVAGVVGGVVAGAGQEPAVAAGLDDHGPLALFADFIGGFVGRPFPGIAHIAGVLADGVGGAGEEPAEPSHGHSHGLAAFFTGRRERLFGGVDGLMEGVVELAQHGHPFLFALGHFVQPLFHPGGKVRVHHVGEVLCQQVGHGASQFGGEQAALLAGDIFAFYEGSNSGGISAGAANAFFLHFADEGGLGETGGRLRKVLVGIQLAVVQGVGGGEFGEGVFGAVAAVIATFHIDGAETGELDDGAGGAEQIGGIRAGALGDDVHGSGFQQGVGHLAGYHPFPNQGIEAELVGVQIGAHFLRSAADGGRADGFVGFLGVLAAGAVGAGFIRRILFAVALADVVPGFLDGGRRDIHAVRPHIGNQADGTFRPDIQPFVELLGDRHGALGGEPEFAAGILLQSAGDERRGRTLAAGALIYFVNRIGGALQFGFQGAGGVLAADFQLAAGAPAGMQGSGEQIERRWRVAGPVQFRFQRPPFYGDESGDLAFPFYNHPQGNRLDAAGRQPQLDFEPEQRADFVADQPIQDAAGLLSVDQLHINCAGMLKGVLNGLFGDFVKDDAFGGALEAIPAGGGLEMPGDGFAFAVGVGGEKDVGGAGAGLFQVVNQLFLVFLHEIFGREFLFGSHAEGGFGQVAHVAHGGGNDVFAAQDLADGAGFGGGFHDDEAFAARGGYAAAAATGGRRCGGGGFFGGAGTVLIAAFAAGRFAGSGFAAGYCAGSAASARPSFG